MVLAQPPDPLGTCPLGPSCRRVTAKLQRCGGREGAVSHSAQHRLHSEMKSQQLWFDMINVAMGQN